MLQPVKNNEPSDLYRPDQVYVPPLNFVFTLAVKLLAESSKTADFMIIRQCMPFHWYIDDTDFTST